MDRPGFDCCTAYQSCLASMNQQTFEPQNDKWLGHLNPEQKEAAMHVEGPLLILAGAGSGKTTVLVSRTGYLITQGHAEADQICVLTFTNKSARELKNRVSQKLGVLGKQLWAGTFHSFGLHLLRDFYEEAGLPKQFGILDQSDSQAIVKDLLKVSKNNEKSDFAPDKILSLLNTLRGLHAMGKKPSIDAAYGPDEEMAEMLWPRYVERLEMLGVVDFEDLILRPLELFRKDPRVHSAMKQRFKFFMVDEFQDTNALQMHLLDQLTEDHQNLAVVGDDDQAIYGWRGAEVKNILHFPQRYEVCKTVRLERNYRSQPGILDLANAIISKNKDRHSKVLKPGVNYPESLKPELFVFADENQEIEQIVDQVRYFQGLGFQYHEIALLFRSNSMGGLIEGVLRRAQIPYRLSGGMALFDRKEIKDVIAFLRSCLSPNEVSCRRIINLPPRGIGPKALNEIAAFQTVTQNVPFWTKAKLWQKSVSEENSQAKSLGELFDKLELLKDQILTAVSPKAFLLDWLSQIGYRNYVFQQYKSAQAAEKQWLFVDILARILESHFEKNERSLTSLRQFLDRLELRDDSVADSEEDQMGKVQLMTLHACKGLEFPVVLMTGLEEEILPHRTLGSDVSEERRLFYVGVTRAEKHLVLSYCLKRQRFGRLQDAVPSRFLLEVQESLFEVRKSGFRPLQKETRDTMVSDFLADLKRKIKDREMG